MRPKGCRGENRCRKVSVARSAAREVEVVFDEPSSALPPKGFGGKTVSAMAEHGRTVAGRRGRWRQNGPFNVTLCNSSTHQCSVCIDACDWLRLVLITIKLPNNKPGGRHMSAGLRWKRMRDRQRNEAVTVARIAAATKKRFVEEQARCIIIRLDLMAISCPTARCAPNWAKECAERNAQSGMERNAQLGSGRCVGKARAAGSPRKVTFANAEGQCRRKTGCCIGCRVLQRLL